jgi:hypothetical protein
LKLLSFGDIQFPGHHKDTFNMAEKRQESPSFTVKDRRLFTADGELRNDVTQEVAQPNAEAPKAEPVAAASTEVAETPAMATSPAAAATAPATGIDEVGDIPPPPTAAEQRAQADAYLQSSKELDSQVELSGGSAKEFEMTFERFMASLYMTAMMQLGLMHQQGAQPQVDIIGARQTVDTFSLIAEKTKGNLTSTEENFLHNSLYELRMAYVEVTNALARPPQPGAATGTRGR